MSNSSELVILIGLPGAGKTSFYRERFAGTHVLVSKDLLRNRSDRQTRQLALIDAALAAGKSVVVDNLNATVADRAALIAAGRRRDAAIAGYFLDTALAECSQRNRAREGRARVPQVALHVAAKQLQQVTHDEGFDRVYVVRAADMSFR